MHVQISSQILKPLFCDLSGSFAIWGSGATNAHLPHGFSPTNKKEEEEEELWSPKEAGVNKVYVCRTSWAMPLGRWR
jgi:hypothetical protein